MAEIIIFIAVFLILLLILAQNIGIRVMIDKDIKVDIDYSLFTLSLRNFNKNREEKEKKKKRISFDRRAVFKAARKTLPYLACGSQIDLYSCSLQALNTEPHIFVSLYMSIEMIISAFLVFTAKNAKRLTLHSDTFTFTTEQKEPIKLDIYVKCSLARVLISLIMFTFQFFKHNNKHRKTLRKGRENVGK